MKRIEKCSVTGGRHIWYNEVEYVLDARKIKHTGKVKKCIYCGKSEREEDERVN